MCISPAEAFEEMDAMGDYLEKTHESETHDGLESQGALHPDLCWLSPRPVGLDEVALR